jgi:hypothetical protein
MMTENFSGPRSLNAIDGRIADTELNIVSGGDKATTTKGTTKPTTPIKPMVWTLEQVLVSSY